MSIITNNSNITSTLLMGKITVHLTRLSDYNKYDHVRRNLMSASCCPPSAKLGNIITTSVHCFVFAGMGNITAHLTSDYNKIIRSYTAEPLRLVFSCYCHNSCRGGQTKWSIQETTAMIAAYTHRVTCVEMKDRHHMAEN